MIQHRVRRSLVPGLAAVAMLAGLSGCGGGAVTATGTGPGTAVQVGDVRITQAEVDRTAEAICIDHAALPVEESGGPVARIQVKQLALNLLALRAQAEQVAEEYDVEPGPEVKQDLARWKSDSEQVPEDLRDDFATAMNTDALLSSVLVSVGEAALAEDGVRNPSPEEAQQRGNDVFATWADGAGITVDPRYAAVVKDGLLRPGRTSLSVPVSRGSVWAWAQTNDREQASPDYVESLPESQRCG